MENIVLKNINEYNLIKSGDKVGVGFSGGSDSVALLFALKNISKQMGFRVVAIHINHQIRGEEAMRDQVFAENFCKQIGVDLVVKSVNAPLFAKQNKYTLEEGARILRYNCFQSVKKEMGLNSIALAHHLQDQAETILMHIGRGSGLNGIVGMTERSGDYIRPLLCVTKADILQYIKANGLSFVDDSTNSCVDYTRNFVRKNVVEPMLSVYPKLCENLYKLSKKVQEENDFLDSLIKRSWIKKVNGGVEILDEVASVNNCLKFRVIIKALKTINASVDIEEKHIKMIADLFNKQVGKSVNLPNGVIAIRKYVGVSIIFEDSIKNIDFKAEFKLGKTKFNDYVISVQQIPKSEIKFGDGLYIDPDRVPKGAYWRMLEEGDSILKFDGKNRKLKQFLVDKKVDSTTRNKLPLLMYGSKCLVVYGVEISSMVGVLENSKRVVKIW